MSRACYICWLIHCIISFSVAQTQLVPAEGEEYITTINSRDFADDSIPKLLMEIPLGLVQAVLNSNEANSNIVRVVSFLFYNVEDIFPSGLPGLEMKWVCIMKLFVWSFKLSSI